jgi:hypothetical protein
VRPAAGLAALLLLGACSGGPKRLSSGVEARLRELDEILASKNDNDPRLDRDFSGLSDEEKDAFRRRYDSLPLESRNERGTIVFLLGRNLATDDDWRFFRRVVDEAPCLSLADCSKSSGGASEPGDDVTLAYPALVALKLASRADHLKAKPLIEDAAHSRSPALARLAGSLQ